MKSVTKFGGFGAFVVKTNYHKNTKTGNPTEMKYMKSVTKIIDYRAFVVK